MDSENVKGTFEKISGKIKETVGEVTGNEKLKNEGRLEQAKGVAHDTLGDVKDAGRSAADSVHDTVKKIGE